MDFSSKIIQWYAANKRDLPWRNTQDPYLIWLSEIILQQTRVAQGLPYFTAFSEKYPTVLLLAKAPEHDVLKLWQGLGYYSRARNMHASAQDVVRNHKGKFPDKYASLLQLKGVGEYTAAAIASFAHNEPVAVVDGNVYRLLARFFGIYTAIDSSQGKKDFKELAEQLLNKKKPGMHNQAIMEFGSQQCAPVNPSCESCTLKNACIALNTNTVSALPVKAKKTKVRQRFFYYLHIVDGNKTYLHKRGEGDIWQGLYEFPLIETEKEVELSLLLSSKEFKKVLPTKFVLKASSAMFKHVLSHQHIYAVFLQLSGKIKANKNYTEIKNSELANFPVARLMAKYLEGLG